MGERYRVQYERAKDEREHIPEVKTKKQSQMDIEIYISLDMWNKVINIWCACVLLAVSF